MILYQRVKELAKKQGLSMNALEDKIGLSQNSTYKWKTNAPNSSTVNAIADYFNVSTDYLLGRTDNPKMNNDKPDVLAAHIADDVTDEEMEEILQYIEFIKSKRK